MTSPIRIAVIGGGLAGAIVANSLRKTPLVDVQVYESAPEFSERGLGIGLSKLALQALEEIIPSATDLLRSDAGAVDIGASRIVIGSGPKAGALVCDIEGDAGLAMTRGPLLKALLSLVPNDILHAAKKLASLEQTASGVNITFEDGTAATFDAVIGADGIFSTVRKHVLQGAEEHGASPVGGWECRNLVPVAKAKAVLGETSFEVDREYCWVGDGGFMMHALVDDGTMVQCIVACVETDFPPDRKRTVTREVLEDVLDKSWFDGPIGKQMVEIMLDQESPIGYSIWEHKTTPTYSHGRVCLVGDAAHTTSPYQGAGGGLAIEDAFILGNLLSTISSATQLEAAFKAFDMVRRPRCQKVIDTSRASGQLLSGQTPDVGVDAEKMATEMDVLFGHIDALDLQAHKQAALDGLQKLLAQ
ncbi:FAD/NAD(P)-binding domain-containing protein [Hypoxylon rubiginosum]|uniref:FAD/NAD(P)-binding domain-containing protein n=1 Tax=Hypoxylon rubiginosum TaxID=110542 RepID=A0ACC0CTQ1_9PEZI|nr:FAD/NAD(P)-binding domain-containing protein [Hypoxylon rubiginosum]